MPDQEDRPKAEVGVGNAGDGGARKADPIDPPGHAPDAPNPPPEPRDPDEQHASHPERPTHTRSANDARTIAAALRRCASGIFLQLQQLDEKVAEAQRRRVNSPLPPRAISRGPAKSDPVHATGRPRSRYYNRWEPTWQSIEWLIREGKGPSCLRAAKLVIAALQQGLLTTLEEAKAQITVLGELPRSDKALKAFWERVVMSPLRSQFPAHFYPDEESHEDDGKENGTFGEDARGADSLRYYDPGDPRNEYAIWPRACQLLAELIEGESAKPKDDRKAGGWLTPGQQAAVLNLGDRPKMQQLQFVQKVRAWAAKAGLPLRTQPGQGRATDVSSEDWHRVAQAWRESPHMASKAPLSPLRKGATRPAAQASPSLDGESERPTHPIRMCCTGCQEPEILLLNPNATRSKAGTWGQEAYCPTCKGNRTFVQS